MNIQSAAALASQASMNRGGKNQVRQTDTTPQIAQINQTQAPAVGALAPLVMPVPDYESANTLQQALTAISSFGSVVAQAGNFNSQTVEQAKQQSYMQANNEFRSFKEARIRAQNDPNYEAMMTKFGANTTQWIDANIGNEQNIQNKDAAETFRTEKLSYLSNEISPFHRRSNNLKSEEMLTAYASRLMDKDPELSFDQIAENVAQFGIDKGTLIPKLIKETAATMGMNGNSKDLEYILGRLNPADKKVYGQDIEMAFNKGHEYALDKAKIQDAETMRKAQEMPNANDAIKFLKDNSTNAVRDIEDYSLALMQQNPTNWENAVSLEPNVKSAQGKAKYELSRDRAGKAVEEDKALTILKKANNGEMPPEEVMLAVMEATNKWKPGVSPGRQEPGSLSPDTGKQLLGSMGGMIKSQANAAAFQAYIETGGSSAATAAVMDGARERGLLDGSPKAIQFALDTGIVVEGAINAIYTNSIDVNGEAKDVDNLLAISRTNIKFAGTDDSSMKELFQDLREVANSPIKLNEQTKKIMVAQLIKRQQGSTAGTTVDKKRYSDANEMAVGMGVDTTTQNTIREEAWTKGHIDPWSVKKPWTWFDGGGAQSVRDTTLLTPSDIEQIKGRFAQLYIDGNNQSSMGYGAAWNQAIREAGERLQPIVIDGNIVGRVNQEKEPAWDILFNEQLKADFPNKDIRGVTYFGKTDKGEDVYAIKTGIQQDLWHPDTEKINKDNAQQRQDKRDKANSQFGANAKEKMQKPIESPRQDLMGMDSGNSADFNLSLLNSAKTEKQKAKEEAAVSNEKLIEQANALMLELDKIKFQETEPWIPKSPDDSEEIQNESMSAFDQIKNKETKKAQRFLDIFNKPNANN